MASHPKFSLRQQASVRDHIDSVKLVQFLLDHALTGSEKVDKTRITAALGLLKKCLPDLSSTELSGGEDENGQREPIHVIFGKG